MDQRLLNWILMNRGLVSRRLVNLNLRLMNWSRNGNRNGSRGRSRDRSRSGSLRVVRRRGQRLWLLLLWLLPCWSSRRLISGRGVRRNIRRRLRNCGWGNGLLPGNRGMVVRRRSSSLGRIGGLLRRIGTMGMRGIILGLWISLRRVSLRRVSLRRVCRRRLSIRLRWWMRGRPALRSSRGRGRRIALLVRRRGKVRQVLSVHGASGVPTSSPFGEFLRMDRRCAFAKGDEREKRGRGRNRGPSRQGQPRDVA
jgi:hypothetical protein